MCQSEENVSEKQSLFMVRITRREIYCLGKMQQLFMLVVLLVQ